MRASCWYGVSRFGMANGVNDAGHDGLKLSAGNARHGLGCLAKRSAVAVEIKVNGSRLVGKGPFTNQRTARNAELFGF